MDEKIHEAKNTLFSCAGKRPNDPLRSGKYDGVILLPFSQNPSADLCLPYLRGFFSAYVIIVFSSVSATEFPLRSFGGFYIKIRKTKIKQPQETEE